MVFNVGGNQYRLVVAVKCCQDDHHGPRVFRLPPLPAGRRWEVQLGTFHPQQTGPRRGKRLGARSLVLLREAVEGKTKGGAP